MIWGRSQSSWLHKIWPLAVEAGVIQSQDIRIGMNKWLLVIYCEAGSLFANKVNL